MTLEEIKEIAETWFEWPEEDRCHVTYTSAILFARDMYERGQKAERERIGYLLFKKTWNAAQIAERDRIKNIVEQVGLQGNHDKWFDCCDMIMERIDSER